MFARGPEAGAGCPDDIGPVEQLVKEFPAGHLSRCPEPDIGSVDTAGYLVSCIPQSLIDIAGVVHIIGNLTADLVPAGLCKDRLARPLDDVGSPVVLGPVASGPERPEPDTVRLQVLGDHGKSESKAGKARGLGEGPELDRTAPGALTLVDGMGYPLLGNIGLVGRVIEDDRAVTARVVHPLLQPVFFHDGTRRIVWKTQIDQVGHPALRQLRCKAVFRRAGHIDDLPVGTRRLIIRSGPARHDIGVHIDRVDRITYRDRIVDAEDLLDIAAVALGPVGHKDLLRGNVTPAAPVIEFRDLLPQKGVAQVRRISSETVGRPHLVDGRVQGTDDLRRQRLGHISDSQPDHLRLRMGFLIGAHLLSNRGKQVVSRKPQVVFICFCHGLNFSFPAASSALTYTDTQFFVRAWLIFYISPCRHHVNPSGLRDAAAFAVCGQASIRPPESSALVGRLASCPRMAHC